MTVSKMFSEHLQSVGGKLPLIPGTVEQSLKTVIVELVLILRQIYVSVSVQITVTMVTGELPLVTSLHY